MHNQQPRHFRVRFVAGVFGIGFGISSCGGAGVDTQTLGGRYSGTWTNSVTAASGTTFLQLDLSGAMSGTWTESSTGNVYTLDITNSSFNASHVTLRFVNSSVMSDYRLQGDLTKTGSHLDGTLERTMLGTSEPYTVHLTIAP